MAEEVESLILEASVVDNFSRELTELKQELMEVDATEEGVFPLDADVKSAEAMADIEAIMMSMRRLDRFKAEPEVDVQRSLEDRVQAMATRGQLAMGQGKGRRLLSNLDTLEIRSLTGGIDIDSARRARAATLRGERRDLLDIDAGLGMDLANLPDMGPGRAGRRRGLFHGGGGRGLLGRSLGRMMGALGEVFDRPAINNMKEAVGEFSSFKLSMGMLMNILAALIPLLVVFVGTLPMAIAGLVAVATAGLAAAATLGAIGALALGGMAVVDGEFNMEELQQNFEELIDTFLEAFGPLMEALGPLAQRMFRSTGRFMGELAGEMSGLLRLTEESGQAIDWLLDIIVGAVGGMIAFTEAAAPVIAFIAGGLGDIDWFGIFAGLIEDTLPQLAVFAGLIMDMVGPIIRMSIGFAKVANGILSMFKALFHLVDLMPYASEMIGTLIALTLTAVTASALWSISQSALLTKFYALTTYIKTQVLGAIYAYIASMYGATAAIVATTAAVVGFLAVLTFGLAPVISGLVGGMGGVADEAARAADQMGRFRRESGRAGSPGAPTVGGGQQGGPAYGYGGSGGGTTVVAPDVDTGLAVGNTMQWSDTGSETTNTTSVEERQHSDD